MSHSEGDKSHPFRAMAARSRHLDLWKECTVENLLEDVLESARAELPKR